MRLVEHKRDVIILMDSITRLGTCLQPCYSAKWTDLSGGIDPAAFHRPKRFFGAARNIEEGGSLTILATALVETGSRMDDVIYEEFKGTGNMELHLDRPLAEEEFSLRLIFAVPEQGKKSLLIPKDQLENLWAIRKSMTDSPDFSEKFFVS